MFSLSKIALFIVASLLMVEVRSRPRLPSVLYDVDELVSEFKNAYTLKLSDLKKNYRNKSRANVVEFSSHEDVLCAYQNREAEAPLSRLEYFYRKLSGSNSFDNLSLYDCNGDLRLKEELFVQESEREALTYDEWSESGLSVKLKAKESLINYKLSDGLGQTLFELTGRRVNSQQVVYEFKINSQVFMLVRYDEKPNESRVTYTFQGFEANYGYKNFYRSQQSFGHSRFSFQVIAKDNDEVTYLSSRNIPLARNTFVRYFTAWALDQGFRLVKKYIDFHLYFLPPTEVVSTGGGNSRLLEEIRLNLNRLLNNLNLNLLELFLRGLLKSVDEGMIIDRRPPA